MHALYGPYFCPPYAFVSRTQTYQICLSSILYYIKIMRTFDHDIRPFKKIFVAILDSLRIDNKHYSSAKSKRQQSGMRKMWPIAMVGRRRVAEPVEVKYNISNGSV